jgi:hypothetical protein
LNIASLSNISDLDSSTPQSEVESLRKASEKDLSFAGAGARALGVARESRRFLAYCLGRDPAEDLSETKEGGGASGVRLVCQHLELRRHGWYPHLGSGV